jgi:hypothetical protein
MNRLLRDEALLLLEGRGAILDVAREVTSVLREAGLDGAIIGGVAVVLHGYVRTTVDVDVFVGDYLREVAAALKSAGFSYRRSRGEFRRNDVPVHLVTASQTRFVPDRFIEIDDVQTVSLPDLVATKLSSGTRDMLRAIDLADVIGLIRSRRLTPAFAAKLPRPLRAIFRKLARAVAERG